MSKSKNKNFVKYNNFENFIKQTNENTLFQNRVIEKTVLNLMMADSEKQQLATQYLTDEHFFYQGHKDLFRYIKDKRELIGFGSSVDFFEIRNMIEDEESKIKYPLVTTNLINEISSMFVNEENFLNNVENLIELNKMRNLEVFYNLSLDAMSHNKKITW
ncbi:Replicative DNA helicase, partial [Mycoplasmopsis edwardii]